MARRRTKITPIMRRSMRVVEPVQTHNLYTDYGNKRKNIVPSPADPYTDDNFQNIADDLLDRLSVSQDQSLDIVKGGQGLGNTRRALARAGEGAPIHFYDIENVGEPSIGKAFGEDKPLFGITQVSVGRAKNASSLAKGEIDVDNIVFRQTSDVTNHLTNLLDNLEKDYSSFYDLTERERGSLADIATFSNSDLFGGQAVIDGKTYRTLPQQEAPVPNTLAGLTTPDNIQRMRQGLENISNPKLTTDPENIVDLFAHSAKENAVLAGHNVERHDQPGSIQFLKQMNASDGIIDYMSQPQIDTLRMAQDILNEQGTAKPRNYQLGTLYRETTDMPFGEGQAHNAGYDVRMNAAVFNSLNKQSRYGEVEDRTVNVKDKFQVENYLGFNRSSFNQHRGQFDVVTKINPDTGKHELQYDGFRRATGRGSSIFEFQGELEPVEIEGVTHYGVSFFNPEEETYHRFLRTSRSEIDDIFEDHLVTAGEMPQDQLDYIHKDNIRRRYNDYFTRPASGENDTVTNRLQKDYEIAHLFDDERNKLYEEGMSTGVDEIAVEKTFEKINRGRKHPYGKKRVREVASLTDRLLEEEDFWKEIGSNAQSHAGVAEDPMARTQRENLYYRNVFNTLSDVSEQIDYGYEGMEMFKMPSLSNPGEFTHRNVQSPGQMQALVRNELGQDMDRAGRGKTGLHFQRLMDSVGGALDDEEKNHLKRLADKDLKQGNINQGTVDEIANTIYRKKELLKANGVITNKLPGFDIETPFAVDVLQDGSDLTGKTPSELSMNLHNYTADIVDRQIARGSNQQGKIVSKDVVNRLKKSDEIQKQLREGVIGTNAALGLKGGKAKVFSDSTAEKEVEKIISNFHNEGFQVRLDQVDGSDRVMLFATPTKDSNFSSLSFSELEASDKVFSAPLPLYSSNMGIDTLSGEMRDIQHTRIKKDANVNNLTAKDVTIESSSEGIFRQIGYSPKNIREAIEEGEDVSEAIRRSQSSLYHKSNRLGIPSGYRNETAKDMGYTSSSREAGRHLMISQQEYFERYAEENYPEVYDKFLKNKKRGGSDNILDAFKAGQRSRFRQEATGNWTQSVGAQTGVYTYAEGLNANQSGRGIMSLMPPQLAVPFGQMHSGIREQANKTINYRTIDREPLERYFSDTFGEDSLIAQISTAPAQTSFANQLEREEAVRAYEVNTLRVGNEQLAEATKEVKNDFQKEIDALISEGENENSPQVINLRRNIEFLESGRISTFEDEFIMSEDLMNSIRSSEQLELDVGPYELDTRIEDFFKENLGIEELEAGLVELDSPLTVNNMRQMGILDEDNVLTVGQMMQDVVLDDSGLEYGRSKRKRLQKGAQLEGIEITPEGRAKLLINNMYEGMAGNKTVRTASGARETSIGVPQEIVSRIGERIAGDSNIQAISAFEKLGPRGRRGTGSAYTDMINTSAYNVAGAIDRLYTDGSSGLGVVDDYFENKKLTGNRMTDYQDFIQNKFVQDINDTLGSEQIAFNADSTQPFEFASPELTGTPKERQEYFKNLVGLSTEQYGVNMDDDYAVVRSGYSQHAISYWQGTSSRARYGAVELNLINQTLQGPTDSQVEQIQSIGEIDGIDFSQYKGFSRQPGESMISRNLQHLSGTTGRPEEFREYANRLKSARNFQKNGGSLESIQNSGNIIVDIAGTYEFEKDSNFLTFGEGEDQYTVVDGSRINIAPKDGMPSGADIQNTYSNLYSVDLYGEGIETTIGDLVEEQNASVYAQLVAPDTGLARDAALKNEVVEVVPMLRGERQSLGDVFLQESEAAQVRAFEAAYELAHGVPDDITRTDAWRRRRISSLQNNMDTFMDVSGRQLASKLPGEHAQIMLDNSTSFTLEGRNFLNTEYRPGDITMGRRQAQTLIRGRAQTILDANEVDTSSLLSFSELSEEAYNELSSSDRESIQENYILDRLIGPASEDETFNVFTPINRQPSQDEGSLLFGSVRIDQTRNRQDDSGGVDPRIAALMGGDYDGDTAYATTYPYLEDMSPEDAVTLQKELSEMAEYSTGLGLAMNHEGAVEDIISEGKNSFMSLLELDEEQVDLLFANNLTEANTMMQIMSDESMIQSVGSIYNTVVGTRDAISTLTDFEALAGGDNIVAGDMRRLSSDATGLLSRIQQSAIDRKKMTPQQVSNFLGLDSEMMSPEGLNTLQQEGTLIDYLGQFDQARASLPSDIQSLTTDTAGTLFEKLENLDILSYGEDEVDIRNQDLQTFTEIGQMNEAMAGTALGGFDNPFLRVGFSTANENRMQFEETMRENPAQIPLTRDTQSYAELLFSDEPEVISNWQEASEMTSQSVLENIERIKERGEQATTGNRQSQGLIQQLANARMSESSGDRIRSSSGLYNQFKEGVSGVAQSTAFRAAAGVTAAWTVARAMKSGPTPEGNEAEQEYATAEEVAPSQLLTSPTARIQPGAQGVNLTVQASGNLSEQEVAGLINNEIGAMTGSPMEMNIHVNDNTARLDNKFYQRVVDKTFGF